MHDFAERGIASHWKYKSSEKLNHAALKEYDWLRDLVEIIEKDNNPEHFLEYTENFKCLRITFFVSPPEVK